MKRHRIDRPQRTPDRRKFERTYRPVWKCIYCGDEAGKKLGREHIIAAGLKGDHILPRASCSKCAKITGKFEAIVANKNFGTFRRVMDIRSGRRPPPTELLRLAIKNPDGSFTERLVDPSDYPAQLLLPKLPRPGVLTGNIHAPLMCDFKWVNLSQSRQLAIEERLGGEVAMTVSFDVYAFIRMVAKIGYATAAAEIGLENFTSYVTRFILGQQPEVIGGFVGQTDWILDGLRSDQAMHHMYIYVVPFEGRHLVIAGVHLFCAHTPIVYTVVVGKLAPTESFWKWEGLKRLAPHVLEAFRAQYDKSPVPDIGGPPRQDPLC